MLLALLVTHDLEMDGFAGPFLFYEHLQFAGVGNRLSVEFRNHVARAQTRLRSRRIRRYAADHRAPVAFFMSKNLALSGVTSAI